MSLRAVNLNLMPVLRELLRKRSVARAAAVLGLSRSATSEALGRLREMLGDPLLVQTGRTMVLTARAAAMIDAVEELCGSAERLLHQMPFDPARSARDFGIATSDYGVALVTPAILALRRKHAPDIRVSFSEAHHDVATRLATRTFDFAVLARFYLEDMMSSALRFAIIARHRLVAIFRHDHPLAAYAHPAMADLESWPLISIAPEPGVVERHRLDAIYGSGRFSVAARVQHATLLPRLVSTSDCWAIVPEGIAAALTREGRIVQRPLPFDTAPIEMCLVWSIANDSDAAHHWFRSELLRCLDPSAVPTAAIGTIDFTERPASL